MARQITKQHATNIAKKLKATYEESGGHRHAIIYHDGKVIASFGIRRGSEKDQGHDHIQEELYVNSYQAKLLAACPLSREEWIKIMKDKNMID